MNALAAKFAREKKDKPSEWLIVPGRAGMFKLVNIAGTVTGRTKSNTA